MLEAGIAGGSATALYQIAGPLLFLLPVSIAGHVREHRIAAAAAGVAVALIGLVRAVQLAFGSGPANWSLLGVDLLVLAALAAMAYLLVGLGAWVADADMHNRVLLALGVGFATLAFPVGWLLGSPEFVQLVSALYTQLSELSAQAGADMPWDSLDSFRRDIVGATWQTYGISAGLLVGLNHLLARPIARRFPTARDISPLQPGTLRLPRSWLYVMVAGLAVMLVGRGIGVDPLSGLGWTYFLAGVFAYGLLGAGLGIDWLRFLQERQMRFINAAPAVLFLLLVFRPTRLLLASGMLIAGLADQWTQIRPQRHNGAKNNENNPDE